MKQLLVPYCEQLDFRVCAEADIEEFGWRKNDYMPKTVFRLCWNHTGLAVEAVSHETTLRQEAGTDGSDVWHDSCMEFFFGPAEPEHRYINLEVNPKGTIVMGFGSSRSGRAKLEKIYKSRIGLSTEIHEKEGLWLARYTIPFELLGELFELPPNEEHFREWNANFYKCGEMTEFPHYGMWSKVESEEPDFHRPEFFGKLSLVE